MRKTKLCCICGSAVSLSNFSKHEGSRKCLSGGKQTDNAQHDVEQTPVRGPGV